MEHLPRLRPYVLHSLFQKKNKKLIVLKMRKGDSGRCITVPDHVASKCQRNIANTCWPEVTSVPLPCLREMKTIPNH